MEKFRASWTSAAPADSIDCHEYMLYCCSVTLVAWDAMSAFLTVCYCKIASD